ncbi:SIR2 family protein [Vibrio parahaemolyticus]|uniref:SIR2 family protein n=1 Tax=Vibrio parahaemolyticus TaxID=670 RepID=UPI001EFC36C5|nr:SIR2 family protein [Vibrio parahaemolyticus]MCG9540162.1 SIR2 family protein [Vibrio parahaemolyticus]
MAIEFLDEGILVPRLKSNKKGTTFLLGSAFSAINDGAGIPNVEQVCEFIEQYAEEKGVLELYTERSLAFNGQEKYQQSFGLIAGLLGPDSVNEIIHRVIKSNEDEEGKQRIPQGVKDFVAGIKEGNFKVNNIITTNFDTLLEEEFENQGILVNSVSIVADSYINDTPNGLINIIHLHGIWNNGDSMHTRNQLQLARSRIESSLQNLLSDQTVVIMAYSGWEDSFTRSLATTVINNKSNYDLLWCFFEQNEAVIEKHQQELFQKLSEAISRGRIYFFNGIDCNSVFAKLSTISELKKKEMQSAN